MTAKEALQAEYELHQKWKAEVDKARWVQAEAYRLRHMTSIACGHDDGALIFIGDFDFTLCADCTKMIVEGLAGDE